MTTEPKPEWNDFLKDNKWTTYLAYELKNSNDPKNTLLKYEALLTQCSYLSRMAYCPADIFCRMTQHLDVTPNAFNNYIRAIEKIYDRLFNYKCSFDSKYIQEHPEFAKYFNPVGGEIPAQKKKVNETGLPTTNNPEAVTTAASGAESNNNKKKDIKTIGFFVQNKERMNVYLYFHHNSNSKFNPKKTLFIAFKGSSSIEDFKHDLKSAAYPDKLLSELSNAKNTQKPVNSNSNAQKKNKP